MKKIAFSVCALMFSMNSVYCEQYSTWSTPSSEIDETSVESDSNIKDSITFSSAYFESQYTNKQLANFGLELTRGTARLEDFITNNIDNEKRKRYTQWFARAIYIFIYNAFEFAYHEIGHGLRVKAYGKDFQLTLDDDDDHSEFTKDQNFFKFFIKNIGNFDGAATWVQGLAILSATGEIKYTDLKEEEELVFSAGGMNNETYMTERITRDFHNRGRLSFYESFSYFLGKLYPTGYALTNCEEGKENGFDPIRVENLYKKLGISATRNDIASCGLVSFWLSGTTYSIMKSIFSPDKHVTPISFYNFQAPDMFAYITSKGISYRLVSAYKCLDNLKFLFGAEHVFRGKSTTEVHLGADISFWNTNLEFVTTFCNGFNIEAACSINILDNLAINIEAGTYACKSMLGERHAKNLKDGKKRCSDIAVSISYRY